ncbi:glycerol-3-phosphate 1-O-acyltransferase PlsY [Caulobacter sp. S45]|uniref:glycerol-3-phosphate 1-O-acyltransferase PlsY n=1 Tax=Caulobacter sp. S45 TaxID=1641861 RepID=UPI00131E55A5|nr:glycerol-3-phosphate 1-O-acyltransferase PlsY [Caulobacter sp. S45]
MSFGLTFLTLASVLLGGYLLGSIPFGVIATRLGGVGDLRKVGSGNIGATNVLRTGRKDLALITLIGDAAKGAIALLVARALLGETAGALAGGAAFVGHLFPVWLRFKGGKGVATALGVMLAAAWPVGLTALAVWVVVFAVSRISSLSALTAAVLAPLFAVLWHAPQPVIWLILACAVLVVLRHRQNIARLTSGQEPKFGKTSGSSPQTPSP